MNKNRLEAFSDGVLAVIITIMVLEMKAPHEPTLEALRQLWPIFLSYILSFIFIGIYWNNHHHLLQVVRQVNGRILWANLHLLFWLSLIPFVTAWVGQNHFSAIPVALYGVVLFMAGAAYFRLSQVLILHHGKDSALAKAVGKDGKGKLSLVIYAIAIAFAFRCPWISCLLYAVVAAMWLVPDRRIEKVLEDHA